MKIFLICIFLGIAILFFTLGRLWELTHADFTMTQKQADRYLFQVDPGAYVQYPSPMILEN